MVSVHELAEIQADRAGAHLELLQKPQPLTTVRCPVCKGLRAVSQERNASKSGICRECRKGNVIPRTQYHRYWQERFTETEIREMALAIWGT